jgi:hypothetical protein
LREAFIEAEARINDATQEDLNAAVDYAAYKVKYAGWLLHEAGAPHEVQRSERTGEPQ